jgi:hypothetical protein
VSSKHLSIIAAIVLFVPSAAGAAPLTAAQCQVPTVVDGVKHAIEQSVDQNRQPYVVLKIYNVQPFADEGYPPHRAAQMVEAMRRHEDLGPDPFCEADVVTNHGPAHYAYRWQTIEGDSFVYVEPWN